jgi:hypothetical protein
MTAQSSSVLAIASDMASARKGYAFAIRTSMERIAVRWWWASRDDGIDRND